MVEAPQGDTGVVVVWSAHDDSGGVVSMGWLCHPGMMMVGSPQGDRGRVSTWGGSGEGHLRVIVLGPPQSDPGVVVVGSPPHDRGGDILE